MAGFSLLVSATRAGIGELALHVTTALTSARTVAKLPIGSRPPSSIEYNPVAIHNLNPFAASTIAMSVMILAPDIVLLPTSNPILAQTVAFTRLTATSVLGHRSRNRTRSWKHTNILVGMSRSFERDHRSNGQSVHNMVGRPPVVHGMHSHTNLNITARSVSLFTDMKKGDWNLAHRVCDARLARCCLVGASGQGH